jgi:hypothetical protein
LCVVQLLQRSRKLLRRQHLLGRHSRWQLPLPLPLLLFLLLQRCCYQSVNGRLLLRVAVKSTCLNCACGALSLRPPNI